MPPAENLAALRSPTPWTRLKRSFQSLKSPFLRSATMFAEIVGPMPLIASSSACVALLASTVAKAEVARSAASAATNRFSMRRAPKDGWIANDGRPRPVDRGPRSGRGAQRGGVAADAVRNVGEGVVAADAAQSAEVRFGEALVLA